MKGYLLDAIVGDMLGRVVRSWSVHPDEMLGGVRMLEANARKRRTLEHVR